MPDLDKRELASLGAIAAVVLWMGVYPESFMSTIRRDVGFLLARVERANPPGDSGLPTPGAPKAPAPGAPGAAPEVPAHGHAPGTPPEHGHGPAEPEAPAPEPEGHSHAPGEEH
jgi:NADH-quinone oxidoreductase subunit M